MDLAVIITQNKPGYLLFPFPSHPCLTNREASFLLIRCAALTPLSPFCCYRGSFCLALHALLSLPSCLLCYFSRLSHEIGATTSQAAPRPGERGGPRAPLPQSRNVPASSPPSNIRANPQIPGPSASEALGGPGSPAASQSGRAGRLRLLYRGLFPNGQVSHGISPIFK